MKNNKIILPAVFLVVGIISGFTGGYYYRNYSISKMRGNFSNVQGQRFTPNGNGGQNRNISGFNGTNGQIISNDNTSLTVKLNDGSTKIIILSDSTTYSDLIEANKSDLKTGINIAVFGTTNSDGSVTAERIQLNPLNIIRPSTAPSQ
jgi:hypothetical protein